MIGVFLLSGLARELTGVSVFFRLFSKSNVFKGDCFFVYLLCMYSLNLLLFLRISYLSICGILSKVATVCR